MKVDQSTISLRASVVINKAGWMWTCVTRSVGEDFLWIKNKLLWMSRCFAQYKHLDRPTAKIINKTLENASPWCHPVLHSQRTHGWILVTVKVALGPQESHLSDLSLFRFNLGTNTFTWMLEKMRCSNRICSFCYLFYHNWLLSS